MFQEDSKEIQLYVYIYLFYTCIYFSQILSPCRWLHSIEQSFLCYIVGPWLFVFLKFLQVFHTLLSSGCKCYRLGSLNTKFKLLTVQEAEKPQIKVLANSASGESPPPGKLQMTAFLLYPQMAESVGDSGLFPFI